MGGDGAQRHVGSVLVVVRNARRYAHDLARSHDASLVRAEEERREPVVDRHDFLGGMGVRRLAFAGARLDQQNADAGVVIGSSEEPPTRRLGQLVGATDAEIGALLLELILDRGPVEPGVARIRNAAPVQFGEDRMIVGKPAASSNTSAGETPRRAMHVWSTGQPN